MAPAIRPEARVISGHNTTRSRAVQTGSRHHAVQGNGLVRRRVQPQQPQQPQQALFAALFTEPPATLSPAYHQLRRRHRHRHYHHHYHRQVSFTVRCHQVAVSAALAVRPSRLPRRLQQHHLPLGIITAPSAAPSPSPPSAPSSASPLSSPLPSTGQLHRTLPSGQHYQLHWQCAHHAFYGAFSSAICPSHHRSSASCSVAVATIGTVIGSAIIITIITESASPYAAIRWQCQLH